MPDKKPWKPTHLDLAPIASADVTVSSFTVYPLLEIIAGGLAPGDTYWGNVYFKADEDEYSSGYGQTMTVDDTGFVMFIWPLQMISGGEIGEATGWISTEYLGEPLQTSTGPAAQTVRIPG